MTSPLQVLSHLLLLLCLVGWHGDSSAQTLPTIQTTLQDVAPKSPYTVAIGVQIEQVVNVDQVSENFQAVVNLSLEWEDLVWRDRMGAETPNFRLYTPESWVNLVDEQGIFSPGFIIHNQQGRRFTQDAQVVAFKNGQINYFERSTVTLQAPEFDFTRYPFDTQVLHIRVDAMMPSDFIQFQSKPDYSRLGDQLGEEEWIFERSWTETGEVAGITGRPTSTFAYKFVGTRHLDYYILRIFLPLLIIILVSWFTFFLNDFSKRVDVAVANLLVFVAFNFTVSSELPRLGYLTFMDTIIFTAFVFSGLVVLVNVVFRRLQVYGRESVARRLDKYTIWGYPLALIALVGGCWIWFVMV